MFKFFIASISVLFFTTAIYASSAFPEAYNADNPISPGTVVSLKEGSSDTVETANQSNATRLFGVVVENDDADFIVNPSEDQVLVQTVGPASMFVSDVNGPVEVGDLLTISPIAGVAMKSNGDTATIGTALSSFNSDSMALGTKEVTTSRGEVVRANFGRINVQAKASQQSGSSVPSFLAGFGESVAGKPVSSFRLFTALAVMLITLVASASLLYGTIRTAIISIGRNPLSRASVYKGLIQVFAIVTIVFIAGASGAYIILTA